jgi:cyclomaltodextrinase
MLATFVPQTFVGNHDVTRIASAIDDERHLPHALVTLFTVAGTPSVYYGDEQAFRGTKEERAGGDDAVRPQFPASPADLSPLGEGTYRLHQELIGLRRRHPWLHRAGTTTLHLTNTALLYEVQADGHRLVTALNLDDTPLEHDVPGVSEVVAGAARLDGTAVTVAPHGWAVLS